MKYSVTYNVHGFIGNFKRILDVASTSEKLLKQTINKMIEADNVKIDGQFPKVRDILLITHYEE